MIKRALEKALYWAWTSSGGETPEESERAHAERVEGIETRRKLRVRANVQADVVITPEDFDVSFNLEPRGDDEDSATGPG